MKKSLSFLLALLTVLTTVNSQTIDNSFGNNGKVITELSSSVDGITEVRSQPDGKIIALGSANNLLKLARYNTDGTLDTTFGASGIVNSTIPSGFNFLGATSDIEFQADGKIVLLGVNTNGNARQMFLMRYTVDGLPDTSFNTNGIININSLSQFGTNCMVNKIIALPNNKIVISIGNQQDTVYLLKFETNGSLDTTFGTNGISTITAPEDSFSFLSRDMCMQTDGSILITAWIANLNATEFGFCVIKCNANGTLNASFGNNGFAITDLGTNQDLSENIKVQSDGKILVSGVRMNDFAVARYNTDGSLDTTFNTTGIAVVSSGSVSFCTDMILQADGKIILAGNLTHDFGCIRYNSNGTLDTTFGTNGKYSIDFGASYDYGRSILQQADGKFVLGGMTSYMCSNRAFALTRFSSTLDVDDHQINTIAIYPNPTNGVVEVKSSSTIKSVALYDIQGKLFKTQNVNDSSLELDLSDQSSGIYLLNIETENGFTSKKIVKR